MSLTHAILGFLADEPQTGYELKSWFDKSVSYFWQADQAQIYRTLDKLTEQGFTTFAFEIQESRPNRKIYTITEAGRAELADWLSQQQPQQAKREPFLVQMFFGHELPDERLLEMLKTQVAEHQAQLDEYKNRGYPPVTEPNLSRQDRFKLLTLDYGIRFEQMSIDWVHLCIEQIKAMADSEK